MTESIREGSPMTAGTAAIVRLRWSADELRRTLRKMRSTVDRARAYEAAANARRAAARSLYGSMPKTPLTPREVMILRLIEQGLGNQQIAKELSFGHGTIKLCVRDILKKFATSSRTAAVARAIRSGSI